MAYIPFPGITSPGATSTLAVGNPSSRPRSWPRTTDATDRKVASEQQRRARNVAIGYLPAYGCALNPPGRVGHQVHHVEAETDMPGDAGQGLQAPVPVVPHSEVRPDHQMPHPELVVEYPQEVVGGELSDLPVELDRDHYVHAKLPHEPSALIEVDKEVDPRFRFQDGDGMVLEGDHAGAGTRA